MRPRPRCDIGAELLADEKLLKPKLEVSGKVLALLDEGSKVPTLLDVEEI